MMLRFNQNVVLLLVLGIPLCWCYQPLTDYSFDPKCLNYYNKTGSDIIKTPNFPGLYDFNINCGWMVESTENDAIITITFHYFDLELSKDCSKYDYVIIYQQELGQLDWDIVKDPSDGIPRMIGYCGQLKTFYVSATVKRMFIMFHSDGSNRFTGFNASFSMIVEPGSPKILKIGEGYVGQSVSDSGNKANGVQRGMITLSCNADASPPPTYQWCKVTNGTEEPLRSNLVQVQYPNGTIQFNHLMLEDAGTYRCTAKNKLGKDARDMTLYVAGKCLCNPVYYVSWFPKSPYTVYEDNGELKGIFYAILNDMFNYICGNCTLGHGVTEIKWIDYKNDNSGLSMKERNLGDLKQDIDNNVADIFLPIETFKSDNRYRNTKYFFPLVDSPGIAFLVIGPEKGSAAKKLFASIFSGWPVFVLVIIMIILAGMIIWAIDMFWKEDGFSRSFIPGVIEGVWWAFVSMTTVGYGDIVPKGVPGRLFAVLWIFTGVVIISIFTGVISTSLTVIALSSNVDLYGTDVAALENSLEYRLGVTRNAKMKTFATYSEMKGAMDRREVQGSLIDAYAVVYEQNLFSTFIINNIIPGNKASGIVLGPALEQFEILNGIKEYIEKNAAKITALIQANVPPQPAPTAIESSSAQLFLPSNELFVKSITVCCALFVLMTICGIIYQYWFLIPSEKKIEAVKNLEIVDSKRVKKMDYRLKEMRERLVSEVHEFHERWTERLIGLTKRHKDEQKRLLEKGISTGPPHVGSTQSIRSASSASCTEVEEANVEQDEVEMQNVQSSHSLNQDSHHLKRNQLNDETAA